MGTDTGKKRLPAAAVGWLLLGTAAAALGVHGRWDVAIAAWLYSLFLLRATRSSGVVWGIVAVLVATTGVAAYWLFESGLAVLSPFLLLLSLINMILAVPYLLDRLLFQRLGARSGLLATLVFPTARVLAEYAAGRLSPAGEVYGSLAVTQHGNLPVLQLAAITGGAGITFLLAWFASAGNWVFEQRASWPKIRTVVTTFSAVFLVVVVYGGVRLSLADPAQETVRVAGVSPARELAEQRSTVIDSFDSPEAIAAADPAPIRSVVAAANEDLLASTEREALAGARLVVWSEAAAQVYEEDASALLLQVGEIASQTGAYVLVGLGIYLHEAPYLRNQAILIDPTGAVSWTFDKAHPVPGMETYPGGDGQIRTTDTPFGRLSSIICFDANFPAVTSQGGVAGVDIMIVPGMDWLEFGRTHTEQVALRAVENGYSLVRQDAPGFSQAVDYQGKVLASADYFGMSQETMVANVPISGERTIYSRVGDLFIVVCLVCLVCLVGLVALGMVRLRSRAADGFRGQAEC